MKQIVAFGASSSKKSINKDLASYAASVIEDANVLILDLNDFEMPIYSIDYESAHGIPEKAYKFKEKLKNADGIIISFLQNITVFTQLLLRIFLIGYQELKKLYGIISLCFYYQHQMVTEVQKLFFKLHIIGCHLVILTKSQHSLCQNFNKNFDKHKGITNHHLNDEFQMALKVFISNLQ